MRAGASVKRREQPRWSTSFVCRVLSPPAESGDELDDMLFPDDDDADGGGGGDPFAGLQKFIKGFQAI